MIEDTDLAIYIFAKQAGLNDVTEDLVRSTLDLIYQNTNVPFDQISQIHEDIVVNPGVVRDFARSPISHADDALILLAKFLNFEVTSMLQDAAKNANNEGVRRISLRFILPWCQRWPFPYNRWC